MEDTSINNDTSHASTKLITTTLQLDEDIPDDFSNLESWAIFRIATPVSLTYLFRAAIIFTEIIILGDISTDYLAASALANVWLTMTSVFVERGTAAAVNVVCAQAYGSKNHPLVGYYLQQSIIWTIIFSIPIAITWYYTEAMLIFFNIDEVSEILSLSGSFARYSIIGLIPRLVTNVLARWLQVYGEVLPVMFITGLCMIINIALNIFMVHGLNFASFSIQWEGWGFVGSPIATSLTHIIILLLFFIHLAPKMRDKYHWPGFSWKESMKKNRIKTFLIEQVIPLGIGGCLEEWQLQVVAIMAAKLGTIPLATHNATLSIYFLVTSLLYGLIAASAVRVAHFLGSGKPFLARHVGKLSLYFSVSIGILIGLFFIFGRGFIAKVFSNDPEVWKASEEIQGFVGLVYIIFSFFYAALATLNGQGRPMVVAIAFGVGAWIFGVPLSYLIGIVADLKLLGLWIGLGLGYTFTTLATCIIAWRSDWVDLSRKALERAEVEKITIESSTPIDGESDGSEGADDGNGSGSGSRKCTKYDLENSTKHQNKQNTLHEGLLQTSFNIDYTDNQTEPIYQPSNATLSINY